MRFGTVLDLAAITMMTTIATSPVLAGIPPTPAPVAGVGIGAVALMGIGYRALKRRIDK
jgi:hypothetical protein